MVRSINRTLNLGATRTLRMALVRHPGPGCATEVPDTEVNFSMHDGSEFVLDTHDEVELTHHTQHGNIRCSWEHGMIAAIDEASISCGFVGRHVSKVRDVELSTDLVINSQYDKWCSSERCTHFKDAQRHWRGLCQQYTDVIGPRVRRALQKWQKVNRPKRVCADRHVQN